MHIYCPLTNATCPSQLKLGICITL
jgi:hypothetical protein